MKEPEVAILIPCYNEANTVAWVVSDFRAALPEATIYVYDNNSTDGTAEIAATAGAVVQTEPDQGKGAVVQRMFRDIEADFYIMVDGDHTYDAQCAPEMLKIALKNHCDLVNCVRQETGSAYRSGHRFGNRLLTSAVRRIFGNRVEDMLSGYKVFSRRFVKSFPVTSTGFGIETELTVHALALRMPMAHITGNYRGRPGGSTSKLNTYWDGLRILLLIFQLFRYERPLTFFSAIGLLCVFMSIALGIPLANEYLQTGLVPRFPTAILATGIMLTGFLSLLTGLVLDTVTRGRREMKLLAYLSHPVFGKS